MGDLVTCKAVLVRPMEGKLGSLLLDTGQLPYPDPRLIPVRPLGTERIGDEPQWQIEERGDRLHLIPSLLCPDTGPPAFHTDYHWDCAFEVCPADRNSFDHFREINPGRTE